jgi:hypothetical protein
MPLVFFGYFVSEFSLQSLISSSEIARQRVAIGSRLKSLAWKVLHSIFEPIPLPHGALVSATARRKTPLVRGLTSFPS